MDKPVRVLGGVFLVIVVLIILLGFLLQKSCESDRNKWDTMTARYKKELGNQFILEKDTSTIVDYDCFGNTFTLNNGKVINAELIFKNE